MVRVGVGGQSRGLGRVRGGAQQSCVLDIPTPWEHAEAKNCARRDVRTDGRGGA